MTLSRELTDERECRRLERQWKTTGREYDCILYRRCCRSTNRDTPGATHCRTGRRTAGAPANNERWLKSYFILRIATKVGMRKKMSHFASTAHPSCTIKYSHSNKPLPPSFLPFPTPQLAQISHIPASHSPSFFLSQLPMPSQYYQPIFLQIITLVFHTFLTNQVLPGCIFLYPNDSRQPIHFSRHFSFQI